MIANRICYVCRGPLPAGRKLICGHCDDNTPDWKEDFVPVQGAPDNCTAMRILKVVTVKTVVK